MGDSGSMNVSAIVRAAVDPGRQQYLRIETREPIAGVSADYFPMYRQIKWIIRVVREKIRSISVTSMPIIRDAMKFGLTGGLHVLMDFLSLNVYNYHSETVKVCPRLRRPAGVRAFFATFGLKPRTAGRSFLYGGRI